MENIENELKKLNELFREDRREREDHFLRFERLIEKNNDLLRKIADK